MVNDFSAMTHTGGMHWLKILHFRLGGPFKYISEVADKFLNLLACLDIYEIHISCPRNIYMVANRKPKLSPF